MKELEMLEPIKRMFIRIFPPNRGPYLDWTEAIRYFPYSETRDHTRADLLYIQGRRDWLHVVESEPNVERALYNSNHGLSELNDYIANYKWLALPLDEIQRDSDNVFKECKRKSTGLIAVYSNAGGFAAKVMLNVTINKGDFLYHWPHVCSTWNQCGLGSEINCCPYEKNKCRLQKNL